MRERRGLLPALNMQRVATSCSRERAGLRSGPALALYPCCLVVLGRARLNCIRRSPTLTSWAGDFYSPKVQIWGLYLRTIGVAGSLSAAQIPEITQSNWARDWRGNECGHMMERLGEDDWRVMLRGRASGASDPERKWEFIVDRGGARAAGIDLRKALEGVGD
jgi:hypothetical protein